MDAATVSTIAAAIGAAVTAVATIALWRVTATLAKETTRMADATGQPQIVATLRPNRWTVKYADLTITNSGNASAFAIRMEFDPPLQVDDEDPQPDQRGMPFRQVSILRPGESLSSDVGRSFPLLEKSYRVTTSWLRHPQALKRESLSYTLSLADHRDAAQLGAADPLVQIADEVKHIRDDWRGVASGHRRTKADVFTSADRLHERRQNERSRRDWNRRAEEQRAAAAIQAAQTHHVLPSADTPAASISPDDPETSAGS
jgi:hypothetical protein